MSNPGLERSVVLVTGGTRGVGRGVADHFATTGATVYVTGRTAGEAPLSSGFIPIACDHTDDAESAAVFERIAADHGRLDVLVNSVWGGYERMVDAGQFTWGLPFWQQPFWRWDAMFAAGVRANFVSSALAARAMVPQRSGLIVNISFWAAQKHIANALYGVSKAATDKLTADTAHELREHDVAVVSLYPGMVRTEKVMEAAAYLDLSNSESPQFIGRVIAALASDTEIMRRSGEVLVAAAEAARYNLTDIDGKRPTPLTLTTV
ncbi:SDR family NAD(P)-dependent oxidoreductase [uncultured Caulobacter sp.]|uniref:SDR family NAD(P)-dependent oxidoreductase n=1 Tax=uncultured Caulobacter sp. TaxID=158749 RepID=UPI00261D31AD|nr:SDR family NAD(P)-dependent oxidoreductase [uncultured Caulobacter sp.]